MKKVLSKWWVGFPVFVITLNGMLYFNTFPPLLLRYMTKAFHNIFHISIVLLSPAPAKDKSNIPPGSFSALGFKMFGSPLCSFACPSVANPAFDMT